MNIPLVYSKFLSEISSGFMDVGDIKTAYYFHHNNSDKIILLIHGIGGDFHGMIPLAYFLKDSANILFVDLPSHGNSQLIKNTDVRNIEDWAKGLMVAFRKKNLQIDVVVAHSLGCLAARKVNCSKIWYVNPPIKASAAVKVSSAILYHIRWINQYVYLNYYFSVLRGVCLMRDKQKNTINLVKWLTKNTNVTSRQYLEQARIARDIPIKERSVNSGKEFTGMIVGRFDKITRPVRPSGLRIDKFVELETGHLSVLDSPELIAKLILSE